MITRVRSVHTSASDSMSTLKVPGSMSANRAVAPHSRIAFSVATNVNALVTTSSPGPTPSTRSAATSATVPLATATVCRVPE